MIIFSLVACGSEKKPSISNEDNPDKTTKNGDSDTTSKSPDIGETSKSPDISNKIKIEDIEWHVDEGIKDEKRSVFLEFDNKTEFTIVSFKLTFVEKPDLTEQEKETYFSEIQEEFEMSDDDINTIKQENISMHARAY